MELRSMFNILYTILVIPFSILGFITGFIYRPFIIAFVYGFHFVEVQEAKREIAKLKGKLK